MPSTMPSTPSSAGSRNSRSARAALVRAVLSDVSGVLVFVAIGRNNHDEGTALGGILSVAAPFLLALAVGWLVATRVPALARPESLQLGAVLWATTLVLGMVLRRTLFDKGTALAFVIVATLFLAFVLLGWRLAVALLARRTSRRSPVAAGSTGGSAKS